MTADSMRFICASCGYRARIPASYHGKVILCPGCKEMQVAQPDTGVSTGDTIRFNRVSMAATERFCKVDDDGKLHFTCSSCLFQAKLSNKYAGKAVSCPQCHAAQVIPPMPPPGGGTPGKANPPPTNPRTAESEPVKRPSVKAIMRVKMFISRGKMGTRSSAIVRPVIQLPHNANRSNSSNRSSAT